MLIQRINNIGYPFHKTDRGLFNPSITILQNTKSKVLNLLNTLPGERIMSNNCQFGLDLIKLLFQNRLNLNYVKQQVQYAIRTWIKEIDEVSTSITQNQNSIYIVVKIYVGSQMDTIYLEYMINED